MKNLLGFITAIGFVSSVAPVVISCNTNQENSYRAALGKLIYRVENIISSASQNEGQELKTLKLTLLSAKEIHRKSSAKNEDYIRIKTKLEEDLNDYQHPGYKESVRRLKAWIEDAKKTIINNTEIKSETVLNDLKKAIKEAEVAVSEEVELIEIKIAEQNLRYHLEKYKEWNWDDHKND